jgi:hypothetical protein
MATEIQVWQISPGTLVPIPDIPLEATYVEAELESWIARNPKILGDDLLVIDRQRSVEGVGKLDLLCIDRTGTLVVVELKRDSTAREAVAQALDYASWLNSATADQIQSFADEYLAKTAEVSHSGDPLGPGYNLKRAFTEYFQCDELPEIICRNHRIILAAPRLNASAERIINYLATRYNVAINAVFFKYVRLGSGEEILARSVLVAEKVVRDRPSPPPPTVSELLEIAKDRKVDALVEKCREIRSEWREDPARSFGGSFLYWIKTEGGWRSLFGVSVANKKTNPPALPGELDVWVPVRNLAEVTGLDETAIHQRLKSYPVAADEDKDYVIRLRTTSEAEALVQQLKSWAATSKAVLRTAAGK